MPAPDRRVSRYELLHRIGVGGMAEVYMARADGGLFDVDRVVVVKRVRRELANNEELVQMFVDEARIAAALQHPNIVHTIEAGADRGELYIAMEYLAGHDARTVVVKTLEREGELPLEVALHIVMSVASSLDYAHRQTDRDGRQLGIVHRDVTPQNVMVTFDGHCKLLDFGVACCTLRESHTRSGVLKGKLSYMSPEQANGNAVDARSDLFSLGIMLYELTVGRRLFQGKSDLEILRRVVEEPITPPSELLHDYPRELEAIVMRALARDLGARYQSARELQLDLESFVREQRLAASSTTTQRLMQRVFGDPPALPAGSAAANETNLDFDSETRNLALDATLRRRAPSAARRAARQSGARATGSGPHRAGSRRERSARRRRRAP